MVRAKFFVASVENTTDVDGKILSQAVRLYPVYGETGENKEFWEATPTGLVEMTITNPRAFDRFAQGKSYYIDFTPTDE